MQERRPGGGHFESSGPSAADVGERGERKACYLRVRGAFPRIKTYKATWAEALHPQDKKRR